MPALRASVERPSDLLRASQDRDDEEQGTSPLPIRLGRRSAPGISGSRMGLTNRRDRDLQISVSAMRIALLIVAAMLAAIPALAHSWYPLACCGNMDCFPVACDQLVETVSGWLYVPTGNLFTREQVQPSQDHHCHVCVGHDRDHRSICAFVVPNV
jgi:hypothetical protein